MTRTRQPARLRRGGVAAGLAVTGALLLGACGGGDDGGGTSDEIKGAGKGDKSPSVSASQGAGAGAGDGIKRPEVKLAKDAKNVFEDSETGDPKKDAVLADNQRRLNAIDQIITRQKGVGGLAFYAKGQALLNANEYVKGWVKADRGWAGKTRFYDQTVELNGKNEATVAFCRDQSGGRTKMLKSGKLIKNTGGKKNFVYTTMQVERNKKGVWQAVSGDAESGAERCMK